MARVSAFETWIVRLSIGERVDSDRLCSYAPAIKSNRSSGVEGRTMLPDERKSRILSRVAEHGSATVRELAEALGVTEVTIRRDLNRLDRDGLVHRTHGGVVRRPGAARPTAGIEAAQGASDGQEVDALILAPIQHKAAHALRARALRNGTPLLAESAPREGATYVGPDNRAGAFSLGAWAGDLLVKNGWAPVVLDVTHDLPNTKERSEGFLEGLQSRVPGDVQVLSVNSMGTFGQAYQVARDALRLHAAVNVIFGVNDDAVLGALQAYRDLGRDPEGIVAFNVGGEGDTVLTELARRGPLKACLGLFPHLVGNVAIETAVQIWAGEEVPEAVITPHALLTAETLGQYYRLTSQGWLPVRNAALPPRPKLSANALALARGKRISFVIQYRTHEWYQNLARAMGERARELGIFFDPIDVRDDFNAEIAELRRLIGKLAASYVQDGETIILDTGTPTVSMARYLHGHRNVTVITNSAAVFHELEDDDGIELLLLGGHFQRTSGAFVGRAARLVLDEVRADKAFLVAGGMSLAFGLSSRTPEEADVRRSMITSSREVIALADHTTLGTEALVRVADVDRFHTVVTDAGVLPEVGLEFAQRGIRLLVAGQVTRGSAEGERDAPSGHPFEKGGEPNTGESTFDEALRDT